ncbi:hypothetical protein [Pseudomonas sp.]|uniref:leucine-rich repeat domain-containing protein n=1 Tax=Pseudomonas sp. TaxID=306 RepID=UPI00261CF7DA|nr:hypothetical protein [Pseudomonas sp.]
MSKHSFNAKAFTADIIPAPVKDLFADISFAQLVAAAISLATGTPVSVEDTVTQDMLDKVTVFRVLSGEPRKITSLEGIGHLRALREVVIERQFITQLPEDFGTLAHLTSAHFVNSQLKYIPDWIGNLTALTQLNLSSQIPLGIMRGALPESIGNLLKLERLDLGNNNNLTGKLPDSLSKLTLLKNLLVQSNSFEDLTVLNQMPAATVINARNQALGTSDLGTVAKNTPLPIRLPHVFVQVQTQGDILFDPAGIQILGSPGAYLDENHLYVHLPTQTTGLCEVTLGAHGLLTAITYTYRVN